MLGTKTLCARSVSTTSCPLTVDVPERDVRRIWAPKTQGRVVRGRDKLRDLVADRERRGGESRLYFQITFSPVSGFLNLSR